MIDVSSFHQDYLRRYGYGEPETEEQLDRAVRKLQMFMTINPVGYVEGASTNKATLDRTRTQRCRVPDPADRIELPSAGRPADIPPYLHSDVHWDSGTIYYK